MAHMILLQIMVQADYLPLFETRYRLWEIIVYSSCMEKYQKNRAVSVVAWCADQQPLKTAPKS